MKKNSSLNYTDLADKLQQRNKDIFTQPLPPNEVLNLAKSVHKGSYSYQCPPKHPEYNAICNKEVCKSCQ
jgi:hypothetical protein